MNTTITISVQSRQPKTSPTTWQQLELRTYRKTLSNKKLLNKAPVAKDGTATVVIEREENPSYNIWVELYFQPENGEATLVAESGPHCPNTDINLNFEFNPREYTVLFTELEGTLRPHLGKKKPENLKPEEIIQLSCLACAEDRDIRTWRQAYGWAAAAVKAAKKLHASLEEEQNDHSKNCRQSINWFLSQEKTPAAFFAFTEFGGQETVPEVLSLSEKQLSAKLLKAVEEKRTSLNEDEISAFVKAFACLRNHLLLNTNYDALFHDAKLIHLTSFDAITKHRLLDAALEHGSLKAFLGAANEEGEQKAVVSVQPTKRAAKSRKSKKTKAKSKYPFEFDLKEVEQIIAWDKYLYHFPPLLEKVIAALREKKWDAQAFRGFDLKNWMQYIRTVKGTPKYPIKYDDREDGIAAYARDIMLRQAQLFPTQILVAKVKDSSIPNKTVIHRILKQAPDFDIGTQAVSRYFKVAEGSEAPTDLSARDYARLQELQRSVKLADGVENIHVVEALMQAKLTSAVQVVRMGKIDFGKTMEEYKLPEHDIHGVLCRAKAIYDTVHNAATHYLRYEHEEALMPQVFRGVRAAPAITTTATTALDLPSMETIFGRIDTCACKHCQSVYSPAAYLTDMLYWLKSDVVCANGNSGFGELNGKGRRPDIKHLQLNCDNTNTVLTYIDLVNEVLLSHLTGSPIDALLQDLQTNWTTDRLIATPEHVQHLGFENAKIALQKAFYPLSLPFNVNETEARDYLEELGSSQAELFEVFGDNGGSRYFHKFWTSAYLGLNEQEYTFFVDSVTRSTFRQRFLNLSAATTNLGKLLDKLGLEKSTFQEIYETAYVSGNTTLEPTAADFTGCSWDDFEITSTFDDKLMHRFLRFIRLKRKSGLSTAQLDKAIFCSNEADITKQGLINLAGMLHLAERVGGAVDNVLVWFGNNPARVSRFAADLAVSGAELQAYFTLFGDPFTAAVCRPADVFGLIAQIEGFKKIGLSAEEFVSLDGGTGAYDLTNFATPSKEVWDGLSVKIIAAADALGLKPDDALAANQQTELSNELRRTLSFELGLEYDTLSNLVLGEDPGWIDNCVISIMSTTTDWNSGENALFTVNYRWLYRVSTYQKALGLSNAGLAIGVDILQNSTYTLPGNYSFAWLTNNFGTSNVGDIVWLSRYQELRNIFGVEDRVLMEAISERETFPASLNLDVLLIGVFNNIYKSAYDELNEQEFIDCYRRAQTLAGTEKDLTEVLAVVFQMLALAARTQTAIPTLWSWTWDRIEARTKQAISIGDQRAAIANELEARFSDDQEWYAFITPVHNLFRVKLRDVLMDYYVAFKGFENANAIYAHFLLDPAMGACMKTSRIKLAISGIQLLIHRSLLGLEPNICPDEDDKAEFNNWRKNYRVWEANRKVFLYPENWIVPELRTDKSSFFQDMEDLLLQDEINEEHAEKAIQGYLTALNNVARLDIRGMYIEQPNDPDEGQIHVVGRTFSTPHEYFYRKRKANEQWTAWGKLELDIDGDHLMLAFHNRRLHLFFPLFVEKEHRKIKTIIEGEEQNAPYFEVRMCYSKLEFGKWTAKKILEGTMLAGHYAGIGVYNNLRRKLGQDCPQKLITERRRWYEVVSRLVPDETENGNLVLSNPEFQDYSKVSLEIKDFYFWAEPVPSGDLIIHSRRNFHPDWADKHNYYTDLAYEDSFRISACDDRLDIIPPVITEQNPEHYRFLARPFYTVPNAMQYREGLDGPTDEPRGLYVKVEQRHNTGSLRILRKTNDTYNLTYPNQEKHSMWNLPFFMGDRRHTFFFERGMEKKCIKRWVIRNGDNGGYYVAEHQEIQSLKYDVQPHEHPFTCEMLAEFNQYGIDGLLASKKTGLRRQSKIADFFGREYLPIPTYVQSPGTISEFDFSFFGAYQQYNWEVFFHTPSLIARQLKNNGNFAAAIRYISYIFDPTNRESSDSKRFWMVKPFVKDVTDNSIQNLLQLLGASGLNPEQEKERKALKSQIDAWRDDPFNPHGIAAMRHRAYMLWTVCEYVDILIEWADSLFRQDTMESINEATNLYVLAAEILGQRPEKIQQPDKKLVRSFASILVDGGKLDAFSNALVNIESEIPAYGPSVCCKEDENAPSRNFKLPELLFCIPDNPKLLEMWSRVEDRLFKIRNCRNIEGQTRELLLFEPPIDPALLVRARAQGVDVGEVLESINNPAPVYRFNFLLQKANEFTNEVRSLGSALLSALEKKDAEELTQLRQLHEENILKVNQSIKKMSLEEAKLNLASAQHSKKLVEIRLRQVEAKEYKSTREQNAINQTRTSEGFMYAEQAATLNSALLTLIPDLYSGFPASLLKLPGGDKLSNSVSAVGLGFGIIGSVYRNKASMSSTYANYDRRQEGWNDSKEQLNEELKQVEKSILSAEIRVAIAEKDLENFALQIAQSKEVYDFLKGKFTNLDLYGWMAGEMAKLHRAAYQLAADMARQAERAMEKELGVNLGIIKFNNWDGGRKGLLAAEKLSMQLKELDAAYLKKDQRNFELSTSLSLKLLDPVALMSLITDKRCSLKLDAALLDMNFDGKSLSNFRIKNIALSVPSVTGPYVGTNMKMELNSEEIITSTGVNDPGVFEPNFGQPKYLPFEYVKADDGLELKLILDENTAFDLSTIADVVFHIRYTASNDPASIFLNRPTNNPATIKQFMMSWRHDFPQDWQKKWDDENSLAPTIDSDVHLPYASRPANPFIKKPAAEYYSLIGEDIVKLTAIPTDIKDYDDVFLIYEL